MAPEDSGVQTRHHPCYITKLPSELIFRIIDFVHPGSHLDLACSCKLVAACSTEILQRHKAAYNKYRVSSDLSAVTVPALLRSALYLENPIPAWHVRSFEVWCNRAEWAEWKSFDVRQSAHANQNREPVTWHFQCGEIEHYLEPLESQLSDDQMEAARSQLHDGHDGFMKMLLFALCPRLRDLKFIARIHDEQACLGWLSTAISQCATDNTWPPGFRALRDVAVGIPSGTWMDHPISYCSQFILASLLHLPGIESIYYRNLDTGSEYDAEEATPTDEYLSIEGATQYKLPPRCSTVKHLFLETYDNIAYKFREALFAAPRALVSIAFRAQEELTDVDTIVEPLAENYTESLQSLMFYGPHNMKGYRCHLYYPDELNIDSKLRHLTISVADVELATPRDENNKFRLDSFAAHFVDTFPRSMEVLVLFDEMEYWITSDDDDMVFLDDAIAALIESKECPKLKAIYLTEVEYRTQYSSRKRRHGPRTDKFGFQKAIAAGVHAGVDVYTRTNRNRMRHVIDFPEAPDKYDLVSGPHGGIRPGGGSWIFNPHIGRREPPGCGNCGNCERCFEMYSVELWKGAEESVIGIRDDESAL